MLRTYYLGSGSDNINNFIDYLASMWNEEQLNDRTLLKTKIFNTRLAQ